MNYHIYILYSQQLKRFYVGETANLENRINQHNNGESKYTSQGIPWILIWTTTKPSRNAAIVLEQKLKNLSQQEKIKFMLKYDKGVVDNDLLLLLDKTLSNE